MKHSYEAPESGIIDEVADVDLTHKRKFWERAIWISSGCVIVPPMFGLVGTVIGMVGAFNKLAETGQADPAELSGDISIALLTTMWGLILSAIAFLVLIGVLIRFFTLPKPATPKSASEGVH